MTWIHYIFRLLWSASFFLAFLASPSSATLSSKYLQRCVKRRYSVKILASSDNDLCLPLWRYLQVCTGPYGTGPHFCTCFFSRKSGWCNSFSVDNATLSCTLSNLVPQEQTSRCWGSCQDIHADREEKWYTSFLDTIEITDLTFQMLQWECPFFSQMPVLMLPLLLLSTPTPRQSAPGEEKGSCHHFL